jgi:hypothetical protein
MAAVTVRNVSGTPITVVTHLDGTNTSHTIASGATHSFDARELDQVIHQGEMVAHNPVNALIGNGSIPAKYALIPESAIA